MKMWIASVEKMEYLINNPDVAVSIGLKGKAEAESTFDIEIVNQKSVMLWEWDGTCYGGVIHCSFSLIKYQMMR